MVEIPGYRGKRSAGGARAGKVGKAYGNRSDLNGGKLPVTTAPGQAYGQAGMQAAAQSAVPMSGTPSGPPPPTGAGPGLPPAMPPGVPPPGSMPGLTHDSTNPNEDVMSGATMGPGPGPDSFSFGAANQTSADMDYASRYLPAMERSANGAQGSAAARQVVRLLRAHMNPGQ